MMRAKTIRSLNFSKASLTLSASLLACLSTTTSAQTGANVPSSLDQTSSITSKGGSGNRLGGLTSSGAPVALPEDFSLLRLAPGFLLRMTVFNAPEMSSSLRVNESGDVFIPLAGRIHVMDETLHEAEGKISAALVEQQMFVDPHVALEITAFSQRPVLVAGEVQQPGKIQILSARPLLDVLASSGGVTTAAGGEIEIRRPQPDGRDEVRHIHYANGSDPVAAREALVFPGDTVFVRRAGVIYVLGAVNHPGGYLMVNGGTLNLPQAITLAFGTTVIASTSTAIVVRKQGESVGQLRVPLKGSERGDQPPFPLQDGDMVYVPTSKLKSALVNSSVILSAAATSAIYSATK